MSINVVIRNDGGVFELAVIDSPDVAVHMVYLDGNDFDDGEDVSTYGDNDFQRVELDTLYDPNQVAGWLERRPETATPQTLWLKLCLASEYHEDLIAKIFLDRDKILRIRQLADAVKSLGVADVRFEDPIPDTQLFAINFELEHDPKRPLWDEVDDDPDSYIPALDVYCRVRADSVEWCGYLRHAPVSFNSDAIDLEALS